MDLSIHRRCHLVTLRSPRTMYGDRCGWIAFVDDVYLGDCVGEVEHVAAHVYCIDSTVIIPALARAPAGFTLETEPVEVMPNATPESVTAALDRARTRTGSLASWSPTARERPVVLQYAGTRSLEEFERKARLWIVSWTGDQATLMPTVKLCEGGWEDDIDQATTHTGPNATTIVARLILTQGLAIP